MLVGVGTAGEAGSRVFEIGGRVKYDFVADAEERGVGTDALWGGCIGSGGGARVLCASIGA